MLRIVCLVLLLGPAAFPAGSGLFQSDFPAAEFRARHTRVFERIGSGANAVLQGAPAAEGFQPFRQSNDFYYLCGIETPHAYLLPDGRTRHSTLFLPHRDPATERQGNKLLTAEDAAEVSRLTGVDAVFGIEEFARSLGVLQIKTPAPSLYSPFSPAQGIGGSRDELLHQVALSASDPWDGRPPRHAWFLHLLRDRFPSFELRDLSPILDDLRLTKSEREIALLRRAAQIAGWGILEAMRSTQPGVFEYQLDAAARFIFLQHGARHEAYPSITAGGKNAWMGHYFRKADRLNDGDTVLMDFAPDYRYYSSDVTRMWPANGKYTSDQRALADFILAYRNALLRRIKPGVTPDHVMDDARAEMVKVASSLTLSKESYRAAVQKTLDFRGHLSHPVGMTVHDVGSYRDAPLRAGLVFSIDPMLWIPEEELYVRMEDTVTVTADGVENFTDFLAARPDDIEKILRARGGIVQLRPPAF